MTDLEDIAKRLTRLEDERDVHQLFARYAAAIDAVDIDGWLDCFSEGAVLDILAAKVEMIPAYGDGERHDWGVRHRGHDKLRAFAGGYKPQAMRHVVANVAISCEAKVYRSTSYFLFVAERADGPIVGSFGTYRDRIGRDADGVIRLRERAVELAAR